MGAGARPCAPTPTRDPDHEPELSRLRGVSRQRGPTAVRSRDPRVGPARPLPSTQPTNHGRPGLGGGCAVGGRRASSRFAVSPMTRYWIATGKRDDDRVLGDLLAHVMPVIG